MKILLVRESQKTNNQVSYRAASCLPMKPGVFLDSYCQWWTIFTSMGSCTETSSQRIYCTYPLLAFHFSLSSHLAALHSLDKNLNVLLGDFGLGGKWSSVAPTNATCGSLNYAGAFFFFLQQIPNSNFLDWVTLILLMSSAPEILGAEYYIGPEVDLWSCGAVLYMMLTGLCPFVR